MADKKVCSIPECAKESIARGLCISHYGKQRRTGELEKKHLDRPNCQVKGCVNDHKGRGYCRLHLDRLKRLGTTDLPPKVIKIKASPIEKVVRLCEIEGCGKKHSAKGYCQSHYDRYRSYGSPHITYRYTYLPEALTKGDETSYYLLGAFMADGCLITREGGYTCKINSVDKEWLETINQHLIYSSIP